MRLLLAIWLGKFIYFITRTLKMGGGSAAPGLYALKIDSQLIQKLTKQIPQQVVITGTNGKTTTARMLNHLVEYNKLKTIRNGTGSNMERGIASTLLEHVSILGKVESVDLAIWELDEAAFNHAIIQIKPQIIVFLNAFRDQLDRYGEVQTVISKWLKSLESIDWDTLLLINSGDPNTLQLSKVKNIKNYQFRVTNYSLFQEIKPKDTIQPDDSFQAKVIKNNGLKGTEFEIAYPDGKVKLDFHIPGVYHIYDLLAAFSTYYLLNLPINVIQDAIRSFSPAFGRVERIDIEDKEGYIFLIKNPAGASAVCETIAPSITEIDSLLISLNDNFADGKDVSWIWDSQFEKLFTQTSNPKIICSGTRAQDMAVRLKYAGFSPESILVINDIEKAFNQAKQGLKGRLFILPTYTALLKLQEILAKQAIKKHYWQE